MGYFCLQSQKGWSMEIGRLPMGRNKFLFRFVSQLRSNDLLVNFQTTSSRTMPPNKTWLSGLPLYFHKGYCIYNGICESHSSLIEPNTNSNCIPKWWISLEFIEDFTFSCKKKISTISSMILIQKYREICMWIFPLIFIQTRWINTTHSIYICCIGLSWIVAGKRWYIIWN